MRMRRSVQLVVLAFIAIFAMSSAHGFPINVANTGAAPTGADLTEFQSILSNLYAGASHIPDAINDQVHEGTFFLPAGAAVEFTIQYQDTYVTNNSFGIFSASQALDGMGNPLFDGGGHAMLDSNTLQTLKMFQGQGHTVNPYGQDSPTVSSTMTIDPITGEVKQRAIDPSQCGVVNCGTFVTPQPITFSLFGFYINRPTTRPTGVDYGTDGFDGNYWTVNQLDSATGQYPGFPESMIFKEAISGNQDRWTIAFNDAHNVGPDFNDFVVTMDVYKDGLLPAVPEPGGLLLFGTALLGSVHILRRRVRS